MSNKNVVLNTMPHYSNPRFDTAQTVFGQEEKGLIYNYSDRLQQWDYDKADSAVDAANESGFVRRSANWYEVYLSAYHDKKVELRHVMAGANRSNGHPYAVFGYRFLEDEV